MKPTTCVRDIHCGPRPRRATVGAVILLLFLASMLPSTAPADVPLETAPVWESAPNNHVATGGGWADLDGDGWLDLVAANGNDIYRQTIVVYGNNGDGTLPLDPTWSSTDPDYHGHLDLGDINGDGWTDVAVGVYLGPSGFGSPGRAKVYFGNGAGGFSATPDWTPAESFYCFSVALGDADGDGDLDLACACGDDYYNHPERQRIFYNEGGVLEANPAWVSDEVDYALDVFWGDVDQDGDLDVAFCGTSTLMRVYLNGQTTGGGIATTASWESADTPQYGNTTAFGDWNGDGFPELAVADNNQLGGAGRFKVYANSGGALGTTPAWTSNQGGYGSHVSWCDIDRDGEPELATGQWWNAVRIYDNTGGDLTGDPVWTSSTTTVIENLFWGDVDNVGLHGGALSIASGDGARTFFPLGYAPVRSVDEVRVGGSPLEPGEYVVHAAYGWISVGTPPPPGQSNVEIDFSYSNHLDLGVTNWDSDRGNLLFANMSLAAAEPPPGRAPAGGAPGLSAAVFTARPNPSARFTHVRYQGPALAHAEIDIVDAAGRRVRTLHRGPLTGDLRLWAWDRRDDRGVRQPSGVYFAHLRAAPGSASGDAPGASSGSRSVRLLMVD